MNQNTEPSRWPGGPQICTVVNLPIYASAKEATQSIDHFHTIAFIALWNCSQCGGWHLWTTSATDSNGGALSGAMTIPARMQKLIERTKK